MSTRQKTSPAPVLSVADVVVLVVGVVVGASVFRTPALVAESTSSEGMALLIWLVGGGVSVVGALCYAELAAAYPHAGGDYHYLGRAYGGGIAFLFAWARMSVIQTGSITLLAFIFGDYASEVWSLGEYSPALYAGMAVVALTVLNVAGVQQGKRLQRGLTAASIVGLLFVVAAGLLIGSNGSSPEVSWGFQFEAHEGFGMAMVFVLLTYGGWNEAAYVSAELRNVRHNMARALLVSIGIITLLYLLVNLAYLYGLGLSQMSGSTAVAADLVGKAFGHPGAQVLSLVVAVAALSSANATIFTGARTNFALGRDFSLFSFLGRWKQKKGTPANALWLQGGIVLALVGFGAATRQGFEAMVDYTAPVFWLFFLLVGLSLLILRYQEPEVKRPFRVPFYPFTPIVFCGICIYMLWSSLMYTGVGALLGVGVLLVGIPLFLYQKEEFSFSKSKT